MTTSKISEHDLDEEFLNSLYTTENPPDAEEVGAVITFTDLSKLGLTDNDMSTDDFKANVDKICSAIATKITKEIYVEVTLKAEVSSNLNNSCCLKINNDLSRQLDYTNNALYINIFGYSHITSRKEIIVNIDSQNKFETYKCIYDKAGSNDSLISNFTLSYYSYGFLPLDSSMSMTGGELKLMNGISTIKTNGDELQFEILNDITNNSNLRRFRLLSSSTSDLYDAIKLYDRIDGSNKQYKIFGEHNKPRGSYTGNGSATNRKIEIGGVSRSLLIVGENGYTTLVANGAFTRYNDTVSSLKQSEIDFFTENGVLNIVTNKASVNSNGVIYYYYSL